MSGSLLLMSLLACGRGGEKKEAATAERKLTVIYSNNLDGDIEPCG